MASNLPPVPNNTPVTGSNGLLTNPWMGWFRQLVQVILSASQIDATVAAANAETAATNAASSAAVAGSQSSSASGYAAQAATSASSAASSASNAATSASSAASSASTVAALVDQVGTQAYSPDYIADVVNIPIHRQLIAFQRVTIAGAGSLQIYGRGRIL